MTRDELLLYLDEFAYRDYLKSDTCARWFKWVSSLDCELASECWDTPLDKVWYPIWTEVKARLSLIERVLPAPRLSKLSSDFAQRILGDGSATGKERNRLEYLVGSTARLLPVCAASQASVEIMTTKALSTEEYISKVISSVHESECAWQLAHIRSEISWDEIETALVETKLREDPKWPPKRLFPHPDYLDCVCYTESILG
jgi:hypothetical protein